MAALSRALGHVGNNRIVALQDLSVSMAIFSMVSSPERLPLLRASFLRRRRSFRPALVQLFLSTLKLIARPLPIRSASLLKLRITLAIRLLIARTLKLSAPLSSSSQHAALFFRSAATCRSGNVPRCE